MAEDKKVGNVSEACAADVLKAVKVMGNDLRQVYVDLQVSGNCTQQEIPNLPAVAAVAKAAAAKEGSSR